MDNKKTAQMLMAVAEPTRLAVLKALLRNGELSVGALADVVGVKIVNASHHLGVMRLAGVLKDDKCGKQVFYSINPHILASPGSVTGHPAILKLGACELSIFWSEG